MTVRAVQGWLVGLARAGARQGIGDAMGNVDVIGRKAWRTALVVTTALALAAALLTGGGGASDDDVTFEELWLLAAAQPGGGAIYLRIPDIPGDVKATGHEDEIDILAWSWGVSTSSGGVNNSGAREQSSPRFSELTISKSTDRSSPLLFLRAADGSTARGTVTLSFKAPSVEIPQTYLKIDLDGVGVSSFHAAGSAGERPTEEVAFYYNKITMTYWPQNPDGSLGAPIKRGWDVVANKPV